MWWGRWLLGAFLAGAGCGATGQPTGEGLGAGMDGGRADAGEGEGPDAPAAAPDPVDGGGAFADGGSGAEANGPDGGWVGPPPTLLATGIDPNGILLAAGGQLYFGDASFPEELKRVLLEGGAAPERAVIANPVALIRQDERMYVLDRGLSGGQVGRVGGRLFRAHLGSPAPLPDIDLAEDELEPHQLVLDEGFLYWSIKPSSTSALRRVPVAGGPAETLLTHARGRAVGLAVVGDHLLFATGCCVARVPRAGASEPTDLIAGQDPPIRAMVADREGIYLLVGSGANRDGALLRYPLAGGEPQQLAAGIAAPGQLILDGEAIVWSDGGTRRFTLPVPTHHGGVVYRTGRQGGASVLLAGGIVNLAGFAVTPERLYLATATTQLRPPYDGKLLVVARARD